MISSSNYLINTILFILYISINSTRLTFSKISLFNDQPSLPSNITSIQLTDYKNPVLTYTNILTNQLDYYYNITFTNTSSSILYVFTNTSTSKSFIYSNNMTLLNNITNLDPTSNTMLTFYNFVKFDNSTFSNGTFTGKNSITEVTITLGYLLQPNEIVNSDISGDATQPQIFAMKINSSLNTLQFALTPRNGGSIDALSFTNSNIYIYTPSTVQYKSTDQKIYSFNLDFSEDQLLTTMVFVPSGLGSTVQNFDFVIYGNLTLNYSLVLFYVIVYIGVVSLIVIAGVMRRCTSVGDDNQNLEQQMLANGGGVGMGPGGRIVHVASQNEIDSLRQVNYTEGLFGTDDNRCAICLCDYEVSDNLRVLGCTHHFHVDCLDRWLKNSRHCPLCQQDIITATNVRGVTSPSVDPIIPVKTDSWSIFNNSSRH